MGERHTYIELMKIKIRNNLPQRACDSVHCSPEALDKKTKKKTLSKWKNRDKAVVCDVMQLLISLINGFCEVWMILFRFAFTHS